MSDSSPAAVLIDSAGNLLATTAGMPAAKALTVQGDPAGTPVPVTVGGIIAASSASEGTPGAAVPAKATQVGGSDGTNLQTVRVFDADSGAGTQYVLGTVLRKSSSGGSVEAGTSSDPLRVDPTGTTTQPISAAALPLPAGAATSANLTTLGSQTTKVNDGTNTAAVKAASTAAVATDPALVVAISPNNTVPVSAASLPLPAGAATAANQTTLGNQTTKINDGTNTAAVKAASTAAVATDQALVVAISPNNVVTVTGTVTETNASIGTNNAAIPASSTQVGGSDGTNLQVVRVFDADSGAGTQFVLGSVLRKSASGGSVEAGTSSDPLRVDPTGTTTQPVSGTVTANIGTPGSLALDATLTGGTQRTKVTDGTNNAAVKAASTAAVATDPALVVAISPNNTVPVSAASLPLPAGAATSANQSTLGSQTTKVNDGTNTAAVKAASTAAVATDPALVVAVSPNNTVPISAVSLPLPTGASTSANLTTLGSQTTKVNDGTNTATVKAASTAAVAADTALVVAISPNNTVSGPTIGTHANAWNAAAVLVGGNSAVIDTQFTPFITIFGNSNGNTTLSIQGSQDNTNFYTIATFTTGTGDFGNSSTIGARYIRLQSNTARTLTVTIAGKS